MCKVFPTFFYGFAMVLYHSLKLESILSLHDLYVKLISPFSSNNSAKKSTIKLFVITQGDDESTSAYLQRFNEEMLSVENLIELIATKALINGIYNCLLQERLDTLTEKKKTSRCQTCYRKLYQGGRSQRDQIRSPILPYTGRVSTTPSVSNKNIQKLFLELMTNPLLPQGQRCLLQLKGNNFFQYPLPMKSNATHKEPK